MAVVDTFAVDEVLTRLELGVHGQDVVENRASPADGGDEVVLEDVEGVVLYEILDELEEAGIVFYYDPDDAILDQFCSTFSNDVCNDR